MVYFYLVFRFDIDGLKVEESHNKDHKPYNLGFLSENENLKKGINK